MQLFCALFFLVLIKFFYLYTLGILYGGKWTESRAAGKPTQISLKYGQDKTLCFSRISQYVSLEIQMQHVFSEMNHEAERHP